MCLQAVPLNPESPCTWILEFRNLVVSALFHLDGFIPLPPQDPPGPMKCAVEQLGAAGWVQPSQVHVRLLSLSQPLCGSVFCGSVFCGSAMDRCLVLCCLVEVLFLCQGCSYPAEPRDEKQSFGSCQASWCDLCLATDLNPQEKLSGWESCGTNVIPCRGELPRGGC